MVLLARKERWGTRECCCLYSNETNTRKKREEKAILQFFSLFFHLKRWMKFEDGKYYDIVIIDVWNTCTLVSRKCTRCDGKEKVISKLSSHRIKRHARCLMLLLFLHNVFRSAATPGGNEIIVRNFRFDYSWKTAWQMQNITKRIIFVAGSYKKF